MKTEKKNKRINISKMILVEYVESSQLTGYNDVKFIVPNGFSNRVRRVEKEEILRSRNPRTEFIFK